ncbi:TonB-dependent receptor [Mucilaginibacter sp. PAMB04274]|uniref:SusC/RagA family TonB-linked outer membrane protein n=1 Tax=Mucilaginibacter sp. PAMB04274 TaxID=3138568 RepID=UPI0031F60817
MSLTKYKYILSVLCCLLWAGMVLAQRPDEQLTISGKVLGANRQPLAGVNVYKQESGASVQTGADGGFSFQGTATDVIVFQYAGYITITKIAPELSNADVVLQPALIDAGDADDVYIPFGIRKKRQLTGTVSAVKGSQLPQLPSSTLNNVLVGRLAGLYIQQTDVGPGADEATFLVRGRSSYNSNQQPIILVDGVQRNFTDMDLNEVESISVFKDAASLSWYGMYGANGIISVRTKRGSATRTRITFDAQGGMQTPLSLTRPLDAYTYASLYNEAQANSGAAPVYNQAALDAYRNGTDPIAYPNNNFVDQFIKKAAPVQRYVATVSGGNSFARYFTMISYFNQDGLYKGANNPEYNANSNFQRYNFRTNLDLHVNKNLDVQVDVGGRINSLRHADATNSTILGAIYTTPANAYPLLNPNGSFGGTSLFRNNPLALLTADGNATDLTRSLLATLTARQKVNFIPGLSINVLYSYDIRSNYTSGYAQDFAVYEPGATAGSYSAYGTATPLTFANTDFNSNLRSNEFWGGFDYDKTFGSHGINFTTRYMRTVISAPGSLDDKAEGWSNRLSYNYNQRYFVDVIGTYSGSQVFAPGKQWGFFPAVSAGWIVSEESFLKSAKLLNYLKLRASYGIVGNDDYSLGRRYAYNNYFSRGQTGFIFGTGFSAPNATTQNALANPDLTWERARKTSIGFDAKFLNQMFSLSADYFQELRSDLLTNSLTPSIIGQNLIQVNAGKARYRGVETELSFYKKLNKVELNLFGNYTYQKSKVLAINEEAGLPAYQKALGHTIGSVMQVSSSGPTYISNFLQADGIFQSDAEVAASPVQRFAGTVKAGDIKYKDINGDNVIDNLDFVRTDYNYVPKAYYGFGGSVKYAGVDVAVMFQGTAGRTISINNLVNSGTASNGYLNQFSVNRWTPANANAAIYPRLLVADRANNTQNSDFWLRNGDYLRLKHAEIGYTLPARWVNKIKLSSLRIYLSGFNLLTFDKLDGLGIDPEMPQSGYAFAYPNLRTYSVGINVKF